jgi:hypothetical protein
MHNSDAGSQGPAGRHNGSEIASSGPERRRSRRDSHGKRKSSKDSKKLQRDPQRRRTYSFSPGRNDDIRVTRDADRPPVPPLPGNIKGKGRAETEKQEIISNGKRQLLRSSTQPPEGTQNWERVPTLHKRSAQELPRRKSSKKRKEEHDREAEIKAMVAIMPTRPATDIDWVGRPMKRESRKVKGGLKRNGENPSSDVSLPLAGSIHSSLSDEHQTSYKVSPFDMLAPRPTIRYSENPRYSGKVPDRSESRKRRVSDRVAIPEETLKSNKRIDDLADDLDAGELRELMERDQKRREKRKVEQKIKAEKKIARRQEKQREGEAEAVRTGTPPPVNMERGVMGRDVVGLGIGTSAVVTSSKRKGSNTSDSGRVKRPADIFREDSGLSAITTNFVRSPSLRTEQLTPGSDRGDPIIETAQVGTVAKAQISPPASPTTKGHNRGASSISQMMDLAQMAAPEPPPKPEPKKEQTPEAPRRTSEASLPAPKFWKSFFKRDPKAKRGSVPSSFSNTSRDSMQNGLVPAVGYTPVRSTSNLPKRTMSKFREDLPELPMSPPDSRVQSPEGDNVPPIKKDFLEKRSGHGSSSEDPRVRYDTPTSGNRSLEATRLRDETPTSGHRAEDVPSPEPVAILSQSLASIDSEGSWLSGRKGSKRGSMQTPTHALRDSASSLKRYKDYSESAEELGIAEDEYFSRLTPGPEEQYKIQRRSATVPSSDDENEGGSVASPVGSGRSEKTKWGAVARTPTVVHREPRAKSREGLLNEYDYDSDSTPGEVISLPKRKSLGFNKDVLEEGEPSGLQRATSVDLGKNHARHMSAGSARLLDLKPRASVDSKRLSTG